MDVSQMRSPLSEIKNRRCSGIGTLNEEDQHRFSKLVTKAKDLARQGLVKDALELNKRAYVIYNSEKLAKRIAKMEAHLAEFGESDEEEGDDMVHVGNNFYLYRELYDKLYSHQREGILWFWKLHKAKKGGILGDDMGLGKTIQVIAFLSGLFDAQQVNAALIVLPVAVIINWEKEFEKWAPGIRVIAFHGATKRERERGLGKIHRRGGVILTSYGMVINNVKTLQEKNDREFVWDYIILDEGHKIKNPSTKASKALHSLAARHRLILTGTPVQNNLKEMWALFDWTHQGTLLGTARTFAMEYEQPIMRARQKDATGGEQRLGQEIAVSLKKIITPYFLRRTKAEVTRNKLAQQNAAGEGSSSGDHKAPAMPTFTRKNDLVCWVFLSKLQQEIYEAFVQTEEVRNLLNTTKSPLTALVVLKKICDHPRLLNMRQCVELGINVDDPLIDVDHLDENTAKECAASRIRHVSEDVLVSESGKMIFLIELLDNIRSDGHRALVFSQSRKMLDMIQKVITSRGHKVARLDGTMRLLAEREDVIKRFSNDKSYSVFLLTTQVGGVGLTLTAADRVIIFDPSWNPATDAQAVDRAFRIGQENNVVIYRLITCGSIEEKIYRRQIFKDSITKQTTGDSSNPYRYFSRQELHELFVLDNPRYSSTQVQLMEIHSNDKRRTDTRLDAHIAFLHTLEMFGISDHDLMFSQEAHDDDDEEDVATHGHDYINNRVSKAQQAISLESEENYQLTQQLGKYPAPEVNQVKTKRNTGMEDIPAPARPPGSRPLIDIESLHQRSVEMISDDDLPSDEEDINQSMQDLTVATTPGQKQHISIEGSPRSPTPPPSGSRFDSDDSPPMVQNIAQEGSTNKRRSDQRSETDTSAELSISKRGRLYSEGAAPRNVAGLDDDDCDDVMEDDVREDSHHVNSVIDQNQRTGAELASDQDFSAFDIPQLHQPSEKENVSTPSKLRKRRPSVCNPNTPLKKFTVEQLRDCLNLPPPNSSVVTEEITFSPKANEPLVGTTFSPKPANPASTSGSNNKSSPVCRSVDNTPPSFNHTENYENFVRQVPMNSTVLSDMSRFGDYARSGPSIAEEEEGADSERGNDSQILTSRKSRAAVIDSDEGEQENDTVLSNSANRSTQILHEIDQGFDIPQQVQPDTGPISEAADEPEASGNAIGEEQDVEEEGPDEDGEEEASDEEEEEEEELSEEDQNKYIELMTKSRALYKAGDYVPALSLALDALEIYSGDERAQAYALKIKGKLMNSTNRH